MSTFALKITALILMFLDHAGLYFEGAPMWFRWVGRASYPLFYSVWSGDITTQETGKNTCFVYT